MAQNLTDNWQIDNILTDNWHLHPPHPDPLVMLHLPAEFVVWFEFANAVTK